MKWSASNPYRRKCAGATLVELMFACGIGVLALAAIMAGFGYFLHTFAGLGNYVSLNSSSRNALDQMTRDIRQADGVLDYETNRLSLKLGGTNVLYLFDPSSNTVSRIFKGETNVLLTGCESLRYDIFQRTPISGSEDLIPTTVVTNAKVVQVNWTCSRTVLRKKLNTAESQSAKIVIRKQGS